MQKKAFALGRGEEAERILATRLGNVLKDAEAGRLVTPEAAEQAAQYAVRLASTTKKGQWITYIFKLYTTLQRLCSTALVDELYEVLRKVSEPDVSAVRAYLDVLKSLSELGPADRFLIRRLEGLERIAASR